MTYSVNIDGVTFRSVLLRVRERDNAGRPTQVDVIHEAERVRPDDPSTFVRAYLPMR